MKTNDSTVKRIALAAFPNYRGRKFRVEPFHPMSLASYWSEGSRDYFTLIHLETLRQLPIPQNGTPFDPGTIDASNLPENAVLACHSIFCGKDVGITLYLRPENMAKLLPEPSASGAGPGTAIEMRA